MSQAKANRLTFIDMARTYAIFLALLAHFLGTVGLGGPDSALLVRSCTRMATPMFVFMFGFLVEFVYVNRVSRQGLQAISRRVLTRSFQCYLAYALTAVSSYIGGYITQETFIRTLLFFSNARFGNILRAYAIMLLVTPLIIRLRIKLGPAFLFASLVLLILSYGLLESLGPLEFGILNFPMNVLFGIGPFHGGPSVLGAFSFFFAGMLVASTLRRPDGGGPADPRRFYLAIGGLLLTMLALGALLIQEPAGQAWILFADITYRMSNDPGYYIIGIVCSLLLLLFFRLAVADRNPPAALKFVMPLGLYSIVSYTAGNIILNLFGWWIESVNLYLAMVVFFVAVTLLTSHIHRFPAYGFLNHLVCFRFGEALQRLKG